MCNVDERTSVCFCWRRWVGKRETTRDQLESWNERFWETPSGPRAFVGLLFPRNRFTNTGLGWSPQPLVLNVHDIDSCDSSVYLLRRASREHSKHLSEVMINDGFRSGAIVPNPTCHAGKLFWYLAWSTSVYLAFDFIWMNACSME